MPEFLQGYSRAQPNLECRIKPKKVVPDELKGQMKIVAELHNLKSETDLPTKVYTIIAPIGGLKPTKRATKAQIR